MPGRPSGAGGYERPSGRASTRAANADSADSPWRNVNLEELPVCAAAGHQPPRSRIMICQPGPRHRAQYYAYQPALVFAGSLLPPPAPATERCSSRRRHQRWRPPTPARFRSAGQPSFGSYRCQIQPQASRRSSALPRLGQRRRPLYGGHFVPGSSAGSVTGSTSIMRAIRSAPTTQRIPARLHGGDALRPRSAPANATRATHDRTARWPWRWRPPRLRRPRLACVLDLAGGELRFALDLGPAGRSLPARSATGGGGRSPAFASPATRCYSTSRTTRDHTPCCTATG